MIHKIKTNISVSRIQELLNEVDAGKFWNQKPPASAIFKDIKIALKELQSIKQQKTKFKSFQDFVQVYDDFCKSHIGVGAKMDGAQGKALNAIIRYLIDESLAKNEKGALDAWRYIFNNWGSLTPFIQRQTSLTQINKNLMEILTTLRNGKKGNKDTTTTANSIRASISDRRKNADRQS